MIAGTKQPAQADAALKAYPNPTYDAFSLSWPPDLPPAQYVQFMDAQGQVLTEKQGYVGASWSIEAYPAGVYYLLCFWGDGQQQLVSIIRQ